MTTPELWFLFNASGSIVTVVGRESAVTLGKVLIDSGLGAQWKIRKNQSQTALPISEFLELLGGVDTSHGEISSISKMIETKKQTEVKKAQKVEPEIELPKVTENQWKKEKTRTQAMVQKFDDKKPVNNKRRFERHKLRLRVVVIAGNRSFRSFSENISKGGLLLENDIPQDVMNQKCRVIISSNDMKENIEFEAKLAGDLKNPRALSFQKGNEQFISKLESWLGKKS
jgi:hypothetical protein